MRPLNEKLIHWELRGCRAAVDENILTLFQNPSFVSIFDVSLLLKILPGNSEDNAIDSVRIEVELIPSGRSIIGQISTY